MLSVRVFQESPAVAYLLKTYLVKACLVKVCLVKACLVKACLVKAWLNLFLFELRIYGPVSVHPAHLFVFKSKYFILH